jgi:hypothetical protein
MFKIGIKTPRRTWFIAILCLAGVALGAALPVLRIARAATDPAAPTTPQ